MLYHHGRWRCQLSVSMHLRHHIWPSLQVFFNYFTIDDCPSWWMFLLTYSTHWICYFCKMSTWNSGFPFPLQTSSTRCKCCVFGRSPFHYLQLSDCHHIDSMSNPLKQSFQDHCSLFVNLRHPFPFRNTVTTDEQMEPSMYLILLYSSFTTPGWDERLGRIICTLLSY